jgi:hypothetical protein
MDQFFGGLLYFVVKHKVFHVYVICLTKLGSLEWSQLFDHLIQSHTYMFDIFVYFKNN